VTEVTDIAEGRASGVQVIARAAEMLRALQSSPGGLTQAELAERLGLARSTVHRILGALEEEGFVAVTGTRGRYRVGPEISRMAEAVRRDLVDLIHPFMQDLSRELRETVDLSILDGDRVTFLDQVVAPRRLRTVSAIGDSFPVHACAPGKALLATLSPSRLAAAMPSKLTQLTPNTITSVAALREELSRVRREGIAYDLEEHTEGICAIGAALHTSGPPLAISVPMPTQRFHGRQAELRAAVLACATDLQSLED
jgi:DNA-binding IclR family transcriptional regulator